MLTIADLTTYLNSQEGYRLEFKSARPLFEKKEQAAFLNKLSETVSAFLNSDGGDLIVGIEEGKGAERSSAHSISEGVPRDVVPYENLQRQLCDRVQPATSNLINVVPVQVSRDPFKYIFKIEVRPGSTAYMAHDKRYYVRSGSETKAMDDKDVRIRMLQSDKPRVSAQLRTDRILDRHGELSDVRVVASIHNAGFKTVQFVHVRCMIEHTGFVQDPKELDEQSSNFDLVWLKGILSKERQTFSFSTDEHDTGLLPDDTRDVPILTLNTNLLRACSQPESAQLFAQISLFIDDGLPEHFERRELTHLLRSSP